MPGVNTTVFQGGGESRDWEGGGGGMLSKLTEASWRVQAVGKLLGSSACAYSGVGLDRTIGTFTPCLLVHCSQRNLYKNLIIPFVFLSLPVLRSSLSLRLLEVHNCWKPCLGVGSNLSTCDNRGKKVASAFRLRCQKVVFSLFVEVNSG